MSWGRPSNLTADHEHAHAFHRRMIQVAPSPRYRAILDANREAHNRAAAEVGHEDCAREDYQQALHRIYGEMGGAAEDHIKDQCGGCRFYCCLEGVLGSDWGVCTNPKSPHNGRLMFEHDGCEAVEPEREPASAELVKALEIEVSCTERTLEWARAELAEGSTWPSAHIKTLNAERMAL